MTNYRDGDEVFPPARLEHLVESHQDQVRMDELEMVGLIRLAETVTARKRAALYINVKINTSLLFLLIL